MSKSTFILKFSFTSVYPRYVSIGETLSIFQTNKIFLWIVAFYGHSLLLEMKRSTFQIRLQIFMKINWYVWRLYRVVKYISMFIVTINDQPFYLTGCLNMTRLNHFKNTDGVRRYFRDLYDSSFFYSREIRLSQLSSLKPRKAFPEINFYLLRHTTGNYFEIFDCTVIFNSTGLN